MSQKCHSCAKGVFRSCETPCEIRLWLRKLEIWRFGDFVAISQLQNEVHCAAKWHSCAKKWFCSCEIPCQMELWLRNWEFSRFGASQPFRSCEMGAPVLRSGTRVPNLVSQLRTGFAAKCWFRRGCKISQAPVFALFLLCFRSDFAPKDFISISLQFLLILIIQKPILHQNKLELKHWNQN